MELDAEPALRRLEKLRAETGVKVTLTHLAGKAIGRVFSEHPEINCMVRWGKLYPRPSVDICFLVASGEGGTQGREDLSGRVVRDVDQKTEVQIARELETSVRTIKGGQDISFRGIKGGLGWVPAVLRPFFVNATDWIMNLFNLWSPILGVPQDAFGSAMLTSVGTLDIELAIPRIYPQSRNSLMVALGAVRERPVVRQGQIVVGKVIKAAFVGDHRVVDGLHASYMLKTFQREFES